MVFFVQERNIKLIPQARVKGHQSYKCAPICLDILTDFLKYYFSCDKDFENDLKIVVVFL